MGSFIFSDSKVKPTEENRLRKCTYFHIFSRKQEQEQSLIENDQRLRIEFTAYVPPLSQRRRGKDFLLSGASAK